MGAAPGRAKFGKLGVSGTFERENRFRDWLTNNPTAAWATMPQEFRE